MNNANIKSMIHEEQWPLLYQLLRKEVHLADDVTTKKQLIDIFEVVDETYRMNHMVDLYNIFWKWALEFGRIRIAKKYLFTLVDHLIEYKRIPELRKIKTEAQAFLSKEQLKVFEFVNIISGERVIANESEYYHVRLHPEQWKASKESFKRHLLTDASWDINSWKLIYEFFLRYGHDKEIIVMLAERNIEKKTPTSEMWNEKFHKLYRMKKLNTQKLKWDHESIEKLEKYSKEDLDQMALKLLSGDTKDESVNQDVLITSIKMMKHNELVQNGNEMIIAFSFLGLERVVIYLCEELIKISDEIKNKVSLYYSIAQALYTCGQYYKAIDIATDTLMNEALLRDEKIAFKYLMAESYLNLKNNKMAKELYLEIKRVDPEFRLVKERLSTL